MKKICVVTGTRAEFGLLKPLMDLIDNSEEVILQIIATGMHLSPEFGLTYTEIEKAGFTINKKVEMLLSADSDTSIVKSVGLASILFSDAYNELAPDAVIILGDRYEMLAATSSAYLMKIPVIHLYGGETTEGAYDEGIRHAITKMSYLHFTATEEYRRRVIQLGEYPERVFNVGAIGIDNILDMELLDRKEFEKSIGFPIPRQSCLITYHPVTLGSLSSQKQIDILFQALDQFPELSIVFTMPNSDTDGRVIIERIKEYELQRDNCKSYTSLGQLRYLSAIKNVNLVIGNSSSGIVEVPSLGTPTVNIGDRQKGRIAAESVIHVPIELNEIVKAIKLALTQDFQNKCKEVKNPYGNGGSAEKIYSTIVSNIEELTTVKSFYNL